MSVHLISSGTFMPHAITMLFCVLHLKAAYFTETN